jgi:hypothetical protein
MANAKTHLVGCCVPLRRRVVCQTKQEIGSWIVGGNRLLGFGGKMKCAGNNHLAQSLLRAPRMKIIMWLHAGNVLGDQRLSLGVLFIR